MNVADVSYPVMSFQFLAKFIANFHKVGRQFRSLRISNTISDHYNVDLDNFQFQVSSRETQTTVVSSILNQLLKYRHETIDF